MTDEKFPARTVVHAETDDLNERPDSANAILIGGPGDEAQVSAADAAVVHLKIENLVHRYIRGEERTEFPDIVNPTSV